MDTRKERSEYRKRATGLILKSPGRIYKAQREAGAALFADGALSKKTKELMALAVAVATNCFEWIEHRVEEVLDLKATDGEIAEALDVGLSMGGTLATKSVRWAYHVMEEIRAEKNK